MSWLEPLTNNEYADALRRLLPKGKLWRVLSRTGGLQATLLALGVEFARIRQRTLDAVEEADPSTTTELIDDWEKAVSLPDPDDDDPPTTLQDRRDAVTAKIVARPGSQPGIIDRVITAAGYDGVEIQLPFLFRPDESAAGERLYDETWTSVFFLWRATTPPQGWARLQRIIDRIKPSHSSAHLIDGLGANESPDPS